MTLAEIINTAIAQAVGPTETERILNVNREFVQAMVNKAYHRIERVEFWRFSEAREEIDCETNTRELPNQPDDIQLVLGMWNLSTGEPMRYLDERQYTPNQKARGRVHAYSLWGETVRLWPLPVRADTLELKYYRKWRDLVAANDEPVIPEAWQQLLIDYATGHTILRIPPRGDRFLPASAAQPYLEAFEEGLAEMRMSPLTLPTADQVPHHDLEDLIAEGEW